jgi:hypothetical protein
MGQSKPCWVVLIARDMQVHMPPELYTSLDQAEDEARRWLSTLFAWKPSSKRVSTSGTLQVGRRFALHMISFDFPDPWRAGSLWLGAEWTARSYPRMRSDLLPTDAGGARSWVSVRLSRRMAPVRTSPWCYSGRYELGDSTRYVAASRIKRVCGPWSGSEPSGT